jgi:ABC-type sugar transport system ATPase subunit
VREHGGAVALVSHDLDELLKLSDRIIVLFRGRIVYEAPVEKVSIDELALAMAGRSADQQGSAASSPADASTTEA